MRRHRSIRACVLLVAIVAALVVGAAARKTSSQPLVDQSAVENETRGFVSKSLVKRFAVGSGVGASLHMNRALRVRVFSYLAVALACVWYAGRVSLGAVRRALTPKKLLDEKEEFRLKMMAMRRVGKSETTSVWESLRSSFIEEMKKRVKFEGYVSALRRLEDALPAEELPADMLVDTGDRARDAGDAYTRALIASNGNFDLALADMRERIEWHKKHDLTEAMSSWVKLSPAQREVMYKNYQGGWYTTNSPLGVPIYIERLGTLNVDATLKEFTVEEIVEQRMRMQGYLLKILLPEMAKRPGCIARDKIIHVIDMKGASSRLLSSSTFAVFRRLQEVDKNFPEFLYKTYLVNAPLGVRMIWATFAAMIPARVRAKVRIYGPLSGARLKKFAAMFGDEKNLPDFIGGKCKRKLLDCPPWNLVHMNDFDFTGWEQLNRSMSLSLSASRQNSPSTELSPSKRSKSMRRLFSKSRSDSKIKSS